MNQYPLYRRLAEPQAWSKWVWKNLTPTAIQFPDHPTSCHTDYAILGHPIQRIHCLSLCCDTVLHSVLKKHKCISTYGQCEVQETHILIILQCNAQETHISLCMQCEAQETFLKKKHTCVNNIQCDVQETWFKKLIGRKCGLVLPVSLV
jgi:hypothetical protein